MVHLHVLSEKIERYKFQVLATLTANVISISFGAFIGWGSSAFLLFQSSDSPLPVGRLSTSQISWAGSILCLGAFSGNAFFGWTADRIGRKWSMIIAAVPSLIGWILLAIVKDASYLLTARFIGGIAGGASFVLVPLYSTETSEASIRGTLGSCFIASNNLGTLIAFILGDYVAYNVSPYIYMALTLLYLLGLIFLPETPIYLMKQQREEEAERALRFFRNIKGGSQVPERLQIELDELKNELVQNEQDVKEATLHWSDFSNPTAIRVALLSMVLMAFNQCCGCFAMINYTATIFEQAGSSLSPNQSAMIVGAIQLVGAITSVLLVERAGRKLLLATSLFGATCGHVCLGVYVYLSSQGFAVEGFKWVPIASFSLLMLVASWGILTLPFLVISEIAPHKIRSFIVSLGMFFAWTFAFLILKFLPVMIDVLHLYGCVFLFGAVCFAGGIFILIFVPETKGKSFEEISTIFERKSAK